MLSLPSRWVYVWYEDGKRENVANTDTLSAEEAQEFKEEWEKARGKKVVAVDLTTSEGRLVKTFTF